jgi:TPP-dependent pyruvate/acetoin dehydrogenase alpha subunit
MDIANAAAKLPIAQRAEGYGIPWSYIDGNDLLTVYETMHDAVTYIRSGKGPVLVEAQTYRYFGHSKSDRNLYRSKEEIEDWRSTKDPIQRLRAEMKLLSKKLNRRLARSSMLLWLLLKRLLNLTHLL